MQKETFVQLPNSSPQNRHSFTHVRILTRVLPNAWNGTGFEGALYQPGARIAAEGLGAHPVALEHAGPQGTWRQRREQEHVWILWRYDWAAGDWREIARAVAKDWHWAVVLRTPAMRELELAAAKLPAVDPVERGQAVADELLRTIDAALSPEVPAVRAMVMSAVYDQMAGRLAAAV
jgi:hypothetical protein